MRVVEQCDYGSLASEVGQGGRQALKQANARRLAGGRRAANCGDALQQRCQIVEIATTQRCHILRRKSAKMVLERLGPDAERGGRAEREGPRREADCPASIAC